MSEATTTTDLQKGDAGRPVAVALQNAISDAKGLSALLLAFTGVVAAYAGLEKGIALPPPWPLIGSLVPVAIFVAFYLLPEWREAAARSRLQNLGIGGQLKDPGYFRLTPYRERDSARFMRMDGAETAVVDWIIGSASPIVYLYGQSGVGKSSLLLAAVVPALKAASPAWTCVVVRPHNDPLGALRTAIGRADVIGDVTPETGADVLGLVNKAVQHARSQGKRLLLVIDQFEEVLILLDDEKRAPLIALLRELAKFDPAVFTLLLSLRAEYLTDLLGMNLPLPTLGSNCYEVRPFTQAAARDFIARSGLELGSSLLNGVLSEAAEIEDMPDRVRPVVLNMLGLVLASFKGTLPKGVSPGRLLSGYVRRALTDTDIRACAPNVMRPLVTDVGTKRALPLQQIAIRADVSVPIARGCLIRLADSGLVRAIDGEGERWETAHDFVARLIQPIIQNWSRSSWEKMRPWFASSALLFWIVSISLAALMLPQLRDAYAFRELGRVGLVIGNSRYPNSLAFLYNGAPFGEGEFNRALHYLAWLSTPVAELNLGGAKIDTLEGLPSLPALKSLNLINDAIHDLEGMPELPALEELTLVTISLASFGGMPVLPALQHLTVNGAPPLTSYASLPILPALKKLETNSKRFADLPNLPALEELVIGSAEIVLGGVPPLATLQILELRGPTNFTKMPLLPRLSTLKLNFPLGGASFQDMPYQPELRYIQVAGGIRNYQFPDWLKPASLLTDVNSQQDLVRISQITQLRSLNRLDLSLIPVAGGYDLTALQGLEQLQSISFDGPARFNVEALEPLKNLTQAKITLARFYRRYRGWGPPAWYEPAIKDLAGRPLDIKGLASHPPSLKVVLRKNDKRYFVGLDELGDRIVWTE
ncbi:MAG: hypothetical protein V7608_1198 [Hyphomicrobiales bacterium]